MPNQRRQNKRDENEYKLPGNMSPTETDFGSIGGITPIRQPDAGIQGRSDYGGSVYDQQYFTDDELRRAAEVRQAAERGETDWGSAHDYVEGIRGGYGYSGGTDGSGYNPTGGFSYRNAPDQLQHYQDYLDSTIAMLQNRGPFEYDYASDPAWQSYKKEYTREGRRATEDTLGQYAAMTGGMPSTAAMTAASQAGDYYNARMTDKIPELYQLAYDMYLNEGNQLMQQANMYAGLYGDAYNRWNAEEQRRHDLWREGVDDEWRQKQWDYGVSQDEYNRQLALAQLGADYGDYSGLAGLGINPNTEALLSMTLAGNGRTSAIGSGGSGGGGGYSYTGGGDGDKWSDVLDWYNKYGADSTKDYIKEHYKELGYGTQSAAISGWNNYMTESGMNSDTNDTPRTTMQIVESLAPGLDPAVLKIRLQDEGVKDIDTAVDYYQYLENIRDADTSSGGENETERRGFADGINNLFSGDLLWNIFGGGDRQAKDSSTQRQKTKLDALNAFMTSYKLGDLGGAASRLETEFWPYLSDSDKKWVQDQLAMQGIRMTLG